jgi:hypothetical protein
VVTVLFYCISVKKPAQIAKCIGDHNQRKEVHIKTSTATALFLLIHCLIFCAIAPPVIAADKEQVGATLSEVKQEVGEAFKSIENYSSAQKDEAIKKTQAALADLDARIDHMENRSATKWRSMSEAARKKEQAALRELKRERINVAEWYGSMKNSTEETWEDTKKAFLKSTDALSDVFNKAEQQVQPKKKSK